MKPRNILFFLLTLVVIAAAPSYAANHYIRDGGTGDGSSWASAWDDLPATLVRGDTYYIADGSYSTSRSYDIADSGSLTITIKKATASDHGAETGWNSSYGDGQAVFTGRLQFRGGYYIFNGQTGGGPGSWTSGYGFYFDHTASSEDSALYMGSSCHNSTFSHIEIEGHGDDGDTDLQDGINVGKGDGPLMFSHIYIHDVGRCPIFNQSHNTTWQYIYTGKFENVPTQHSEIASMWRNLTKGVETVNNTTVRWSIFTWADGTGGLIGEWDGADIYGNIFVYLPGSYFNMGGNGLIGGWTLRIWRNVRIYNNSFLNCGASSRAVVTPAIFEEGGGGTGNIFKNNIVWSTAVTYGGAAVQTYDYNEYIVTVPIPDDEPHKSTAGSQPYADYENLNFAMTRATAAGETLAAQYSVDMYGNTRGADGTWDRGAIEYDDGGAPADDIAPVVTLQGTYPNVIYVNKITVTYSCSDNVGVTDEEYDVGTGVNENTNQPTGGSPATLGNIFAPGDNVLYIGCGDAAGNWGNTSVGFKFIPASVHGGTRQ